MVKQNRLGCRIAEHAEKSKIRVLGLFRFKTGGQSMMETKSINERVREFLAVCDEIAGLEDQLASLKASKAELQETLFEAMLDEGVQHVAYDDKTVYRSVTVRATVRADSRPQALEALRELNLGDMIKSEPTVNAQTMAAKVREWIEADGRVPEIIEPFLNVYEERTVRVRKS